MSTTRYINLYPKQIKLVIKLRGFEVIETNLKTGSSVTTTFNNNEERYSIEYFKNTTYRLLTEI